MPAANAGQRHVVRDMGTVLRATAAATGAISTPPAYVTASGFSIAAWVRVFDNTSAQNITADTVTTGSPTFRVTTGGRIELFPRTAGASLLSSACLKRGEWHHVVATWDQNATRATLYCDGQIVAQSIGIIGGVAFAQPTGAITMAALAGNRYARVAFWGRELSQAEVRAECYRSSGPVPVARYQFGEGLGSSANDDFGGAAMTLGNFAYADEAPVQPARLPQDWGSIFQAGAGYVVLPAVTGDSIAVALQGVGSYQVSMWVKLTAAQASIDLLRVTTNGVVGLRLQLDGGVSFVVTARSTNDASGAARATSVAVPLALGQWVHYSAQINIGDGAAGSIKLFRNGILIANTAADFSGQTSIAWTTVTTNCPSWIGAGNAGANPVPGWVGPTRIDPPLTPAQLRTLIFTGTSPRRPYLCWQNALGAGGATPQSGSKPGCVGTLTGTAAWSLDAPW